MLFFPPGGSIEIPMGGVIAKKKGAGGEGRKGIF
jgi:hypothetical protein